ncbi:hypothetical protein QBC35DRAFT_24816 [Podospora australis]|uniref:Uncharacterized protein n=1 Tax=Podospora australis TaxID=1536484 RepID=A0AAN6X351_9PEZI|nr:hypothetical protein QBC35DRAFT_24816 [Podospora australis]
MVLATFHSGRISSIHHQFNTVWTVNQQQLRSKPVNIYTSYFIFFPITLASSSFRGNARYGSWYESEYRYEAELPTAGRFHAIKMQDASEMGGNIHVKMQVRLLLLDVTLPLHQHNNFCANLKKDPLGAAVEKASVLSHHTSWAVCPPLACSRNNKRKPRALQSSSSRRNSSITHHPSISRGVIDSRPWKGEGGGERDVSEIG